MKSRREERRITFMMPTAKEAMKATQAEVFAAGASVAPIRFAIRVEAAMEIGKGMLKVRVVRVERTDWAARWAVEKREAARVRISKARTSASTIRRPGRARRIMGNQFVRARLVRPGQQERPLMKRT